MTKVRGPASYFPSIEAKYGRKLQAAFARPGGEVLRRAIDDMSNQQYQGLIRQEASNMASL